MAGKVLSKAKGVAYGTVKFGVACGLGIIGSGVAIGAKAQNSVSRGLDSFADGMTLALISSMSMSPFEEKLALHSHQSSGHCKSRSGFDWGMAAAHADNQQQYGG